MDEAQRGVTLRDIVEDDAHEDIVLRDGLRGVVLRVEIVDVNLLRATAAIATAIAVTAASVALLLLTGRFVGGKHGEFHRLGGEFAAVGYD